MDDEFWLEFDEGHTGTLSYGDSEVFVNGTGACEFLPMVAYGDFWYNGSNWDGNTTDTETYDLPLRFLP